MKVLSASGPSTLPLSFFFPFFIIAVPHSDRVPVLLPAPWRLIPGHGGSIDNYCPHHQTTNLLRGSTVVFVMSVGREAVGCEAVGCRQFLNLLILRRVFFHFPLTYGYHGRDDPFCVLFHLWAAIHNGLHADRHDFHTAVFSENTCYKQLLRSYESSFIQDCFQWVCNMLPGEFLKSIYSSAKSIKDQL